MNYKWWEILFTECFNLHWLLLNKINTWIYKLSRWNPLHIASICIDRCWPNLKSSLTLLFNLYRLRWNWYKHPLYIPLQIALTFLTKLILSRSEYTGTSSSSYKRKSLTRNDVSYNLRTALKSSNNTNVTNTELTSSNNQSNYLHSISSLTFVDLVTDQKSEEEIYYLVRKCSPLHPGRLVFIEISVQLNVLP